MTITSRAFGPGFFFLLGRTERPLLLIANPTIQRFHSLRSQIGEASRFTLELERSQQDAEAGRNTLF